MPECRKQPGYDATLPGLPLQLRTDDLMEEGMRDAARGLLWHPPPREGPALRIGEGISWSILSGGRRPTIPM